MQKILEYVIAKTWKPWLKWRLSRPQIYSFREVTITIMPGVFHPGFFYSTKFLLEHLLSMDVKNKILLELGCGSGIISIMMARKGARVYASDISRTACTALGKNAEKNNSDITIIHSDLFENIKDQFDFIIVNPPYYSKKPVNEADYAWYCGENHEYFTEFFNEVKNHMHRKSRIIMVLSDKCNIGEIRILSENAGLRMELKKQKKFLTGTEFIIHLLSE